MKRVYIVLALMLTAVIVSSLVSFINREQIDENQSSVYDEKPISLSVMWNDAVNSDIVVFVDKEMSEMVIPMKLDIKRIAINIPSSNKMELSSDEVVKSLAQFGVKSIWHKSLSVRASENEEK